MILIGLDDTDNLQSRGTGKLARQIAAELDVDYPVQCVTRHQLLVDPRVPYTSHNSSAAISLDADQGIDITGLFERVRAMMMADFQPGSDPGLCVVAQVPEAVTQFGRRAQTQVVNQQEARALALKYQILLEGLGGSEDGVIGALAAVGLAASGEDGRYLHIGRIRELSGLQPIDAILEAGVGSVETMDGQPVEAGLIQADWIRPSRRGGRPVQFVDWQEGHWQPLKLD